MQENPNNSVDKATERLKRENKIALKYSAFLEEAKIDLIASRLLAMNTDTGLKRRRLFFLEQAIEKASKSVYPLLLINLKNLKLSEIDKKLDEYDPLKVKHFPKELYPEIKDALHSLNKIKQGLGDKLLQSFNAKNVLKLLKESAWVESSINAFLGDLNSLKVSNSAKNTLEKLNFFNNCIAGYYIIVLSIWIILGAEYEQISRYPSDKEIPINLITNLDNLQIYIEKFLKIAESDNNMKRSIVFSKVN
jgi:hypothetical protein